MKRKQEQYLDKSIGQCPSSHPPRPPKNPGAILGITRKQYAAAKALEKGGHEQGEVCGNAEPDPA